MFIERSYFFAYWFSRFFSECCLFTLVVLKIGIVADKGIRRSRRIQGFPPEGYKSIPPNSPEDTYREEVENYSYARSVVTPLIENPERALVVVQEGPTLPANPVLAIPYDSLLIRVDSSRNIIVEEHPRLSSSPYDQLDMEP
jgi:hypothetical protein